MGSTICRCPDHGDGPNTPTALEEIKNETVIIRLQLRGFVQYELEHDRYRNTLDRNVRAVLDP